MNEYANSRIPAMASPPAAVAEISIKDDEKRKASAGYTSL
jgi:hypothetical protein